jgi:hypothetical protein
LQRGYKYLASVIAFGVAFRGGQNSAWLLSPELSRLEKSGRNLRGGIRPNFLWEEKAEGGNTFPADPENAAGNLGSHNEGFASQDVGVVNGEGIQTAGNGTTDKTGPDGNLTPDYGAIFEVGIQVGFLEPPVAVIEAGMGNFLLFAEFPEAPARDLEIFRRLFEGKRTFGDIKRFVHPLPRTAKFVTARRDVERPVEKRRFPLDMVEAPDSEGDRQNV